MALFGPFAVVRDRCARWPEFRTAFAYAGQTLIAGSPAQARLRALAEGATHRRKLAGGAHAIEMAYLTKPRSEGQFEAHQRYIDVQVMVAGEELMETAAAGPLGVLQAYDPETDVILFAHPVAASGLRLRAGDVAVFWPEDAHRPSLAPHQPALVRKTVIKVPVPA
jgi:biofilm protein TabA